MEYEEALKIGQKRAEAAAAFLEERTGLASQSVCAAKDVSGGAGQAPESERWAADGTWQRVWHSLLGMLDQQQRLDWERCSIDGSNVPARKGAT